MVDEGVTITPISEDGPEVKNKIFLNGFQSLIQL